MPYFKQDPDTSLPLPSWGQGFYLSKNEETGHIVWGDNYDYLNWKETQPPMVGALDSFFLESLIGSRLWQEWATGCPPHLYTDLAVAAGRGSWRVAQNIYRALQRMNPAPEAYRAEWNTYATAYEVPISF